MAVQGEFDLRNDREHADTLHRPGICVKGVDKKFLPCYGTGMFTETIKHRDGMFTTVQYTESGQVLVATCKDTRITYRRRMHGRYEWRVSGPNGLHTTSAVTMPMGTNKYGIVQLAHTLAWAAQVLSQP